MEKSQEKVIYIITWHEYNLILILIKIYHKMTFNFDNLYFGLKQFVLSSMLCYSSTAMHIIQAEYCSIKAPHLKFTFVAQIPRIFYTETKHNNKKIGT